MKAILAMFFAMMAMSVVAQPKIEVMPELAKQVNAYTKDNRIPWYTSSKYDAMVTAQLDNLVPLVQTTHGDYDYTLYRVRFYSVKVVEGELVEKELTFYLERKFPTRGSSIRFKGLWPFEKGCVRVFKLKKEKDKLLIVSLEMETQPKDAPDRK